MGRYLFFIQKLKWVIDKTPFNVPTKVHPK